MDARFSHCLKGFIIIINEFVPRRKPDLYVFVYVNALNADQAEPARFHFLFALHNILIRPGLAGRNIVKRRNDTADARYLANLFQCDTIVSRAIPS